MKKSIKIFILSLLGILSQSCATMHCNKLAGKEKKACIAKASSAASWHSMMGAQQGATDAGNAAANHMMMNPPPPMH